MEKINTIVIENSSYDIIVLINNIAYIKSITGKTGLFNIQTNELIGDMDNYRTIYDIERKIYIQILFKNEIQDNNLHSERSIRVRIYDALNQKIIADNFELIKSYRDDFGFIALKSPIDGKIHLFNKFTFRNSNDIFDLALEDAKILYDSHRITYFVITINGKKGLFHSVINDYEFSVNPILVAQIEFDDIEKMPHIAVLTKNNEKYFLFDDKSCEISEKFESITVDEKNDNIVYCKKGNKTHIYNSVSQELLLIVESDKIIYSSKYGNYLNYNNGEYVFFLEKNGKSGLISAEINDKIKKSNNGGSFVSELLPTDYDEIKQDFNRFYLKKNDKMGLFIKGNSNINQFIDTIYDNIDYLGENYFALYNGKYCDIKCILPSIQYAPIVTKCEIVRKTKFGIIYKKDEKYGIVLTDKQNNRTIIPNEYDSILNVLEYYFILEKNSKKGFMHLGKMIIPMDYDDIQIGGSYEKNGSLSDAEILYLSLRKGNKFKVAKMHNYKYVLADVEFINNQSFDSIDFYKDIMVFKNQDFTYIYDYKEKLLNTYPTQTSVIEFERSCSNENQYNSRDYVYLINDTYFYYKDGSFVKALVDENEYIRSKKILRKKS